MKKFSRKFLIMIISIIISLLSINVFASNTTPKTSFYLSIYDSFNKEFIIENTNVTVEENVTLKKSIQYLLDQKLIQSYDFDTNRLLGIEKENKLYLSQVEGNKKVSFIPYINKNKMLGKQDEIAVSQGDVVEWIYTSSSDDSGKNTVPLEATSSKQTQESNVKSDWDPSLSSPLNLAIGYIDRSLEKSSMYLTTMGVAQKTADIKSHNTWLSSVRKREGLDTPTDIARNILTATFCGYNAAIVHEVNLIDMLSQYNNITENGVLSPVNALLAFDTVNYRIADTAINTRKNLISNILSFQKPSGGFSIFMDSKEDIDTTAMALTVLSSYKSQDNVKVAIENAFKYLASVQTETGGFGYQGNENCESLAQVIIALKSNKMDLFSFQTKNHKFDLKELLLKYQNEDGGFSHVLGLESNAMATEQAVVALSSIKKNDNPYKVTTAITFQDKSKDTVTEKVENNKIKILVIVLILIIVAVISTIVVILLAKKKNKKIK